MAERTKSNDAPTKPTRPPKDGPYGLRYVDDPNIKFTTQEQLPDSTVRRD